MPSNQMLSHQPQLSLIPYRACYAQSVSQIFHDAIHYIDDEIYSKEQKRAWSPKPRSSYHWHKRLTRSKTWLVVDEAMIEGAHPKCCGFINVETHFNNRGYIDSLYVHPAYQHSGIGHTLYEALEVWALEQQYPSLTVDASLLSKWLFLSHGFKVQHKSYQEKLGQIFMGFLMSKALKTS